jgi:CRP-like cAMP-binding protein
VCFRCEFNVLFSIRQTMQPTRNKILSALSRDDIDRLDPHFEPFGYPERIFVERPGEPIEPLYFPETGFISVVAANGPRHRLEIGMVGPEGMTGVAVLLGDDRPANESYTQAITTGRRVPIAIFREAFDKSVTMSRLMRRYALAFLVQTTQTALANGHARIDQRLARWLLMVMDRLAVEDLPLTHELMAVMLGVRRPGVTDALHRLEGDGLVRARRGVVSIRDREGLVERSAGCYGVAEAEYRRLLG